MTKDQVAKDLEQMKADRFRQCDVLNHLNGQIAYAEHVLAEWDKSDEQPTPVDDSLPIQQA